MSRKIFLARLPLMIFLLGGCAGGSRGDLVCFKNSCFRVEIADTDETRMRGLQFRDGLASDQGMLFIFPKDRRYGFWMKDTYITLDMIWLDRNGRVVHIRDNVPPCRHEPCPVYEPFESARYVLEVNAGTCNRLGLGTGAQAEFRLNEYVRQENGSPG